jgi:hypothetical protein
MYTSTIGRTFLNAYNEKNSSHYSAETFFKEKFVPLFFDHPKYMMTAGNSPLENPKLSWEDMIKGKKPYESKEKRAERIGKMYTKIREEEPSDTIARGYPVADDTAGTSGQKSSVSYSGNKDLIYLSWIGEALAIGVSGGISILFNHPQILLDIYDGWEHYRNWLENIHLLKGNQINTWNGHWISHRYDSDYMLSDPMFGFSPLTSDNTPNEVISIPTISWVKITLGISLCYPIDNLVGYLYNIGQTNTTIGFIPFHLSEIRSIKHFYEVVFGIDKISFKEYRKHIENLYGTAYGIRTICQNGSIGIKALEPKDLRSYLPTSKGVKKVTINDKSQEINLKTYLIWIIAMLNNEKLWELSQDTARLFLQYETGAGKTRSDRATKVKVLLESTNSRLFLQNTVPLLEEINDEEERVKLMELCKVVADMPRDNFPYFNTLIRVQYAFLNH